MSEKLSLETSNQKSFERACERDLTNGICAVSQVGPDAKPKT